MAETNEEFTQKEIDRILKNGRDAEMGFTFTNIGGNGEVWLMACDQCGSVGDLISDEPFPHEPNCPTVLWLLHRDKEKPLA